MAKFTVKDLLDTIEWAGLDPETEIRFASQPAWPFEYAIEGAEAVADEKTGRTVLYLGEGRQIGYLPGEAKDALGWND